MYVFGHGPWYNHNNLEVLCKYHVTANYDNPVPTNTMMLSDRNTTVLRHYIFREKMPRLSVNTFDKGV